ncbi:hypothetical protein B0H19DRAFT_1071563 [Mycena capillaripes]|nr:hypothetical protein B0H19DRAFT_1071563 [Mycena capillaripes]
MPPKFVSGACYVFFWLFQATIPRPFVPSDSTFSKFDFERMTLVAFFHLRQLFAEEFPRGFPEELDEGVIARSIESLTAGLVLSTQSLVGIWARCSWVPTTKPSYTLASSRHSANIDLLLLRESVLTLEPMARAHLNAVFTSPRIRLAELPRHCTFLPHLPAGRPVYGDKNMVHTGFSSGFSSFIIFSVVHTGSHRHFGTVVLIHPFFSAPNLGQKRAKKFRSLLDVLISLAPPSMNANAAGRNIFNDNEQRNRDVLYSLTAVLCDSQAEQEMVTSHLDNFFIRYPSKIKS